jgi:hypothetical protein
MDIQSDKNISNINLLGPFSAVLLSVRGIARWLIRFFTLTKEDRLATGIYLGGDGRLTDRPVQHTLVPYKEGLLP